MPPPTMRRDVVAFVFSPFLAGSHPWLQYDIVQIDDTSVLPEIWMPVSSGLDSIIGPSAMFQERYSDHEFASQAQADSHILPFPSEIVRDKVLIWKTESLDQWRSIQIIDHVFQ